jgi:hypothetical protein
MSDQNETSRAERDILGDDYGPGALDEPNSYREDKGDDDEGLSSTMPAGTDVQRLQDGGPPPEGGGVLTTTGGTAGPNSFRERPRSGPGVANTTTGDATTGGLETPTETSTSDASTNAIQ